MTTGKSALSPPVEVVNPLQLTFKSGNNNISNTKYNRTPTQRDIIVRVTPESPPLNGQ